MALGQNHDDPTPSCSNREHLRRILEEIVAQRMAGNSLPDEELIRRYGNLLPELSDALAELARVESARRKALTEPPSSDDVTTNDENRACDPLPFCLCRL